MTDFAPLDLVERFDHVAMAVWDVSTMLPLVEVLGGRFRNGGDVPAAGFKWVQFHLPEAGKLELLQPLDPEDTAHFMVRFLQTKGEGLHHLTFKVTDLATAVDEARRRGFDVVGVDTTGARKEAFLHPVSTRRVQEQFAEWDESDPPEHRASLADIL